MPYDKVKELMQRIAGGEQKAALARDLGIPLSVHAISGMKAVFRLCLSNRCLARNS